MDSRRSHQHHRHASSGPAPSLWHQFQEALHSNQNFEYIYWLQVGMSVAFDNLMRILGPCLIVMATGLIGAVTYLYFIFLLPMISGREVGIGYLLHATYGIFLVSNVYFNYFMCVTTSPGHPQTTEEEYQYRGEHDANHQRAFEDSVDPRAYSFCKKCRIPRPPRSHHCHICKKCILNMDHHCPWINNCVGYQNYRYFVLFLFFLWMACLYGVLILGKSFYHLMFDSPKSSSPRLPSMGPDLTSERSAVVFCFVLAISVGIALTALLGWHLFLIFTAQTTIEFYINKARREKARHRGQLYSNPYDMGLARNWEQVFGKQPWYLAILPSRRPPASDLPGTVDQTQSLIRGVNTV